MRRRCATPMDITMEILFCSDHHGPKLSVTYMVGRSGMFMRIIGHMIFLI